MASTRMRAPVRSDRLRVIEPWPNMNNRQTGSGAPTCSSVEDPAESASAGALLAESPPCTQQVENALDCRVMHCGVRA
jgi:hypothetical protein